MGFTPKYANHKYKKKIIEHFEKGTPLDELSSYLSSLGEEHAISKDTLRVHKRRYMDNKRSDEQLAKAQSDFSDSTDLEFYLVETIVQCQARKSNKTISGKDFQYYDQQMQSAIKLLNELRSSQQRGMSMEEVFQKLSDKVTQDKK